MPKHSKVLSLRIGKQNKQKSKRKVKATKSLKGKKVKAKLAVCMAQMPEYSYLLHGKENPCILNKSWSYHLLTFLYFSHNKVIAKTKAMHLRIHTKNPLKSFVSTQAMVSFQESKKMNGNWEIYDFKKAACIFCMLYR